MVLKPTNHAADFILQLTGGIKGLRNSLNSGFIILFRAFLFIRNICKVSESFTRLDSTRRTSTMPDVFTRNRDVGSKVPVKIFLV